METSAFTGQNVSEVFIEISKEILKDLIKEKQ